MKKLFVPGCICLLVLTIASCKKETAALKNKTTQFNISDDLKGSWELREMIGIQVPGMSPYFAAGNGNTWVFGDSTYERHIVSTAPAYHTDLSGTYKTGNDTAASYPGIPTHYFLLDGDPTYKLYFNISNDTLSIYWGIIAADGHIEKCVRY